MGCAPKQQKIVEKIIRPVRFRTITITSADQQRNFSGIARPGDQAKISFKVAGTINKIGVKVGETVKKGQLIAQLDQEIFWLQLQEAKTALLQVKAQERNAKTTYQRIRALYANQNASRSDLDKARTGYEMTRAGVKAIKKKIDMANLQLHYTRIKAPANGKIAYVIGKENENIAPGYPVVVLNYGNRMELEVGIPETLINRVKKGDKVAVKFEALKGVKLTAAVTRVGISPQQNAPTFPVVLQIDQENNSIKAGMVGKVLFKFVAQKNQKPGIIVPSLAVGKDHKGHFVYILQPQKDGLGKAIYRPVTIGKLKKEGMIIKTGVKSGELIITAGIVHLMDGLTVRVDEKYREVVQ